MVRFLYFASFFVGVLEGVGVGVGVSMGVGVGVPMGVGVGVSMERKGSHHDHTVLWSTEPKIYCTTSLRSKTRQVPTNVSETSL